jgi:glucosamine kinase
MHTSGSAGGDEPGDLVIGGDIGGTSTRIVVADSTGRVRGSGRADGANPVSRPEAAPVEFAAALHRALDGLAPDAVIGGVVGMAGSMVLRDPVVRARFDAVWAGCGLVGTPRFTSDLEVAFASGTDDSDGFVLIAGTGVATGQIRGRRLVRRHGGYGWLLGDEGAGFWLGRSAVRSTLMSLDARDRPRGALADAVIEQLGAAADADDDVIAASLIAEANRREPIALAELSPLVIAAYHSGDLSAVAIVEEAARVLVRAVGCVPLDETTGPIVLAGSILREESPVGAAVRALLSHRCPDRLRSAGNGAVGAATLALREALPDAAVTRARKRLACEATLLTPGDSAQR